MPQPAIKAAPCDDEKIIRPAAGLRGAVTIPGDKSISHRALICGALAAGETVVKGISGGADVRSTMRCLRALGVEMVERADRVHIQGQGARSWRRATGALDAGNSGTTLRLLAGALAGQPFDTLIDGDTSLRRRPMQRIIEPLAQMGARIEAAPGGFAPLRICGGRLRPVTYELPVASAQVKSGVLLAGLFAEGETTVIEKMPTRDHTEIMLHHFGVPVSCDGRSIRLQPAPLAATTVSVPGDFSSAAFLIAAALMVPESEVLLQHVGINPTRSYLLTVLREAGANISCENQRRLNGELVADLRVSTSKIAAFHLAGSELPLVIDEIPVLAVLATQAEGVSTIRDAAELRVKESDRLETVAANLRRLGARVRVFTDGLEIGGPVRLQGAAVDSFGDHRIAMAFAVAGLIGRKPTRVRGASAASISFPEFFEVLAQLQSSS